MLSVRLIRHGESLANAGGVTAEPANVPLTPRGYEQAQRISQDFARSPDLIITSPYLRALETAKPTIARFSGTPVETWNVQEIEVLALNRRIGTDAEIRRPWIEAYWEKADPHFVDGDGAESYANFVMRVRDMLARLAALDSGPEEPLNIAIFSHGQFMKGVWWDVAEASPDITPETMQAFYAQHRAATIANAESLYLRWTGNGWLVAA